MGGEDATADTGCGWFAWPGDATYGKSRHNRLFHDVLGCRRLLLACVELQLVHPVTGERLVCSASPTTWMTSVMPTLPPLSMPCGPADASAVPTVPPAQCR